MGFILTAMIMWAAERLFGKSAPVFVASAVVGLAACYAFGTIWYMFLYMRASGPVGLMTVLGWCVIPFIIPDLIKIGLALALSRRLSRAMEI